MGKKLKFTSMQEITMGDLVHASEIDTGLEEIRFSDSTMSFDGPKNVPNNINNVAKNDVPPFQDPSESPESLKTVLKGGNVETDPEKPGSDTDDNKMNKLN